MLVTCPHCQGYNEISPSELGEITCRICKQTFMPGSDPLFGNRGGGFDDFEEEEPTSIQRPSRALLQRAGPDVISHTSPPPSVDFANLTGDNFKALSDVGGADGAPDLGPIDFDALAADQNNMADLSMFVASGPVPDEDESTVAFSAAVATDLAQQMQIALSQPPAEAAPEAPSVWRVRSARGLVYELMSLDAVVAWLEGKPDHAGVRIARGSGDFMSIGAHPELARRFGGRSTGPAELGLGDLPLALDERPIHTSAPPEQQAVVSPLRTEAPPRSARPDDPTNPVGFAGVLGVVALATIVMVGAVFLGMRSGWLDEMIPPAPLAAQAEASPALQEAIASYEANNLTAATSALRTLARTSKDPRVFRYLTMALHRQKRHQEAREALARYQQAIDPPN